MDNYLSQLFFCVNKALKRIAFSFLAYVIWSRPKETTSFPGSLFSASWDHLVVGKKTLVATGHVTNQNMGGKKSVRREGWQSVLFVAVTNLVDFKTSISR